MRGGRAGLAIYDHASRPLRAVSPYEHEDMPWFEATPPIDTLGYRPAVHVARKKMEARRGNLRASIIRVCFN